MNKLKRILFAIVPMGLMLLLTGCKAVVLEPRGIVAKDELDLLITAVLLMCLVVVPVIILVFVMARRYRESNKTAKYDPNFSHSVKLELVWWIIPLIIIAILATITWITTHQLDPYRPLNDKALGVKTQPLKIEVIALRWKWLFIYPKQHIATVNYLQFPAHTQLKFLLTSDAPMNSFQIQQLGGQIYTMNGMQTKIHLIANKIGNYRGMAVSFSGNGFANMHFVAHASSEQDFKNWVNQVKRSPRHLTMTEYKQLVQPTYTSPVIYYSTVAPNLFQRVINKFMGPMHELKQDKSFKPMSL